MNDTFVTLVFVYHLVCENEEKTSKLLNSHFTFDHYLIILIKISDKLLQNALWCGYLNSNSNNGCKEANIAISSRHECDKRVHIKTKCTRENKFSKCVLSSKFI